MSGVFLMQNCIIIEMLAAVKALCSCLGDLPLLVQRLEMLRGIF